MRTTFFVACVKTATLGGKIKANQHGMIPLVLEPVQGKSPRGINILDGTVAENDEIESGKTYAFKATELLPGDKGFNPDVENRQFNFSRMGEPISTMEMVELAMKNDITILVNPEKDSWEAVATKVVTEEEVEEEA